MGNRAMRVLMTADAVGGVWQYATELAAALAPHGVETLLAVLGPSPDQAQRREVAALAATELLETGLPLDWLGEPDAVAAAANEIAGLARREGIDLVHLNSPALAGCARFGVPLIGVAHGCLSTWWEAARAGQPLDPGFAWHKEMMAHGLRACNRVLAPSSSYAAILQRHYQLPVAPAVVHNGRSRFSRSPSRAMQDCAFTAGRLWDEVKNARALDAVAAQLAFPFHAAGTTTAPHGETARFDHLHCLGQLDAEALSSWLAVRPVFVSAATFEPFGLAVLEAAGSSCALVLSDIPVFRELWDGAAIFADPADVRAFAHTVETCVEDIDLRLELGQAARQRASHYSAERMAAATVAHYRNLLEAKAAA